MTQNLSQTSGSRNAEEESNPKHMWEKESLAMLRTQSPWAEQGAHCHWPAGARLYINLLHQWALQSSSCALWMEHNQLMRPHFALQGLLLFVARLLSGSTAGE